MTPREQIDLFCESVNELRDTGLLKRGFSLSLKIKYSAKEGGQIETPNWPNEEEFCSFLLLFRKFISKKERVFLDRIYNVCYRMIKDEKLRGLLANAKIKWNLANKNASFAFKYNGKNYSPKEVADLWINGKYFHQDEEKRRMLKGLDHAAETFCKLIFLDYIMDAGDRIFWLDRFIRHAIKEGYLSE